MSQTANFKWPQGEDLNIQLVYKEGETTSRAVPINLSNGYRIRMDLVAPNNTGVAVATYEKGSEALSTGAKGQPNINIFLPRSLTLPGGALATSGSVFLYDLFLRNTVTDRQVKILKGSISVEASNTVWL